MRKLLSVLTCVLLSGCDLYPEHSVRETLQTALDSMTARQSEQEWSFASRQPDLSNREAYQFLIRPKSGNLIRKIDVDKKGINVEIRIQVPNFFAVILNGQCMEAGFGSGPGRREHLGCNVLTDQEWFDVYDRIVVFAREQNALI